MTATVLLHYSLPGDERAPQQEGKFLQILWRGEEYLLFAPPALHRYHNQILAHFLEERGVPYHWADAQRLEPEELGVVVVGGGRFRADSAARTLDLWDDSHAYGRFDAAGLAQRIGAASHPWGAYTVRIS